jgi:four helix bundle protein
MSFMFEDLQVYQKAVEFAGQELATSECFDRGYGFLADQINRASVSIAASLAEVNGLNDARDDHSDWTGFRA